MFNVETGKIQDFAKFDVGNMCMVTGGHNNGRVGVIINREKHKGSFEIVHIEDAAGNKFATRITNVFVIGKGNKPLISLPKVGVQKLMTGLDFCMPSLFSYTPCMLGFFLQGKGIRLTILQEQAKRYATA
jgi:small subunit ribosomal protein S4e